ncbi:MAG TPA: hypothetical protein VHB25_01025 [Gemmatimonadaceae bacterium]|nr:hypothetical protein [Gemmatimonadaceae bacterium]
MPEQVRADDAPTDAQALVSAALQHAVHSESRDAGQLRSRVLLYVRARKRVGLRPEEVVIELKTEIAKTLQRRPPAAAWSATGNAVDVLAEQVIRLAIEAYFAE